MSWRDEAEQGLPPQRHHEPAELRRDILDELHDHLAMAADRESESGAKDEQEIRRRVLNEFGDPIAIARELWWGAMKETVMKDWIQIVVNVVLCLSVIGFMSLFYQQMQTSNIALLGALNERSNGIETLLPSVEFVFHRGSIDGPLVEGVQAQLSGKPFNEDHISLTEVSDSGGRAKFGPIRAGQYRYVFTDDESQMLNQGKSVTLYTGEQDKAIHVPVPDSAMVPLKVRIPATENLTDDETFIVMQMKTRWKYGDFEWSSGFERVIVQSDGLYRTRLYGDKTGTFLPSEKITHVYGNHIEFHRPGITYSSYPFEGSEMWLEQRGAFKFVESHDLQMDGENELTFELSDEFIFWYKRGIRLALNNKHGLPERFAWFPDEITMKYPNYVIHEAFLEQGVYTSSEHPQRGSYSIQDASWGINGKNVRVSSLENVPRNLPEGHRLLLAIRDVSVGLSDLDVDLSAHLDVSLDRSKCRKKVIRIRLLRIPWERSYGQSMQNRLIPN